MAGDRFETVNRVYAKKDVAASQEAVFRGARETSNSHETNLSSKTKIQI